MHSILTYIVYIEIGSENKDVLFAVIFGIFFISMIVVAYRMNKFSENNSGSSSDSMLPITLFRSCTAKFITDTNHNYEEIKEKYLNYILKFSMKYKVEQNYEAEQLKFLTENSINVDRTINFGKKESHKKKLLIIIFFFNIYVTEKSNRDLLFIENLRTVLNISNSVYYKIKQKYIIPENNNQLNLNKFSERSIKIFRAYKTLSIKNGSNISEVKEAYRKLVKQYHPDSNKDKGKDIKNLTERFNEITEAYNFLRTELK